MNFSQLVASVTEELLSAGIESASADAKELICHHLSISKSQLSLLEVQGSEVDEEDLAMIFEFAEKRASRIPLQHITGKSYFRNLELEVGSGVFIPRPETEMLVELAMQLSLPEKSSFEVGAGSGAISISLNLEAGFEAHAIEVSEQAVPWTLKNIEKYGGQVNLFVGDFEKHVSSRQYGLLISNPPYIPDSAIPIDPEVYLHDPRQALYSGADGLNLIRTLADSKHYLLPGGILIFEHDESQRASIVEILLEREWRNIRSYQDLNGRDRFIQAEA